MSVQWPLVLFTLFISLGAGTLCAVGILAAIGKDKEVRIPALVVSLCAIGIGGFASVFHVQHFERIFNGFGHLTSGITQELIFIIVEVIVIVVYFVFARKGETPKWVGVLAIVASVLLVAFMAHSYAMASRPAWNNVLMYAFYFGGAFLLGTATVLAIQGFRGADTGFMALLMIVAGGIQSIVVLAYGILAANLGGSFLSAGKYFDSTTPTHGMQDASAIFSGFLTGENALLYWGGALFIGAVLPLIFGIIAKKRSEKGAAGLACAGLVCALVGGIAFRVILYNLGFTIFFIN